MAGTPRIMLCRILVFEWSLGPLKIAPSFGPIYIHIYIYTHISTRIYIYTHIYICIYNIAGRARRHFLTAHGMLEGAGTCPFPPKLEEARKVQSHEAKEVQSFPLRISTLKLKPCGGIPKATCRNLGD